MTLPTIREFLPCSLERRHEFEPCDELKLKLRRQIDLVDDKSRQLAKSRTLLIDLLRTLDESTHSPSQQ